MTAQVEPGNGGDEGRTKRRRQHGLVTRRRADVRAMPRMNFASRPLSTWRDSWNEPVATNIYFSWRIRYINMFQL